MLASRGRHGRLSRVHREHGRRPSQACLIWAQRWQTGRLSAPMAWGHGVSRPLRDVFPGTDRRHGRIVVGWFLSRISAASVRRGSSEPKWDVLVCGEGSRQRSWVPVEGRSRDGVGGLGDSFWQSEWMQVVVVLRWYPAPSHLTRKRAGYSPLEERQGSRFETAREERKG